MQLAIVVHEQTKPINRNKRNYKYTLLTLLLIMSFFRPSVSFKINGTFHFCEVHENRAIWDLPESCQFRMETKQQPDQYCYILEKDDMVIQGKAWKCSQKQTKISTYMDFIGTRTHEETTENVDLTRDDCMEMVRTRKCSLNHMNCSGNYCESSEKLDYYWMHQISHLFEYC